jgi:hypothetical protein
MERGGQAFQVSREKWGKMGKSGLYKTVREDNVFSEFDLSPLSTTFYRFPSHFPSSHISHFILQVPRVAKQLGQCDQCGSSHFCERWTDLHHHHLHHLLGQHCGTVPLAFERRFKTDRAGQSRFFVHPGIYKDVLMNVLLMNVLLMNVLLMNVLMKCVDVLFFSMTSFHLDLC